MRRKARVFLAIIMSLQLLLSGIVTVSAEGTSGIGEAYMAPESPAVTYNMNLDWKFYDTQTDVEIWSAMAKADKEDVYKRQQYDEAKTYHDGKWVMFEPTDTSEFDDYMKLLVIKRKPNRK